ncbi:transglutaminase family protein [Horticoccus sp. 23ND18S-11]|uniref:transglutaminase family protein n=1 Tax=Horticoccus sp. 23ND18S-11 TaxID=3391832 RepID=UPI0039C9D166
MTPPFTTGAWSSILACGDAVEASLARAGVKITMGGEPTFVPIAPSGAEWQTAALGPTKLAYARRFARELIRSAFPGAVVLETSGKHYPGEPLPRWALLVQRLADGKPLWRDPTRLRADLEPGKHTADDAKRLTAALARALAVETQRALPLIEAATPREIIGYVLPLDHADAGTPAAAWVTDDWTASFPPLPPHASSVVSLFPGESPAGLRLPLGDLAEKNLRRALTVEARHGTLVIFIPPLLLASYVQLLAAIEATLEKLKLRDITLAGYAPPPELALPTVGLASDPGVLEINVSPCATWAAYDAQLEQIYAAARSVGLCARKLQFNGREVGTGGGAHLVFGGPDGLLSPFFAFPGLLPSVIRYWQRNPALSYAFTGAYMGPSSQAPRIDESTFEALYELEIACAGAESVGTPQNLALYDLLFRDLLMDRSGNTHRAEISVDKLWNPFAPNGRLGLVEFRAFETHPARAVQSVVALFVRAILARLCAAPCRDPFIRWAGELHDKFFLPAFVWENLAALCADLKAHGIAFDPEWLRPAWEFRFPKIGELRVPISDLKSEISDPALVFRQALEAWPLLGESPNAGTVARTVDSSVDRIEARVSDARMLETGLLLVNGLPCEFRTAGGDTPTAAVAKDGTRAVAACGIRYRAFYLTPSLQPHVPVHAPLLLEWVDRTTMAVVAAARWHVWNPRHASYATAPADDQEAAARRADRWEPWPHTVGQARFVPKIDFPPEGRHTLDLRRYPAQAR